MLYGGCRRQLQSTGIRLTRGPRRHTPGVRARLHPSPHETHEPRPTPAGGAIHTPFRPSELWPLGSDTNCPASCANAGLDSRSDVPILAVHSTRRSCNIHPWRIRITAILSLWSMGVGLADQHTTCGTSPETGYYMLWDLLQEENLGSPPSKGCSPESARPLRSTRPPLNLPTRSRPRPAPSALRRSRAHPTNSSPAPRRSRRHFQRRPPVRLGA